MNVFHMDLDMELSIIKKIVTSVLGQSGTGGNFEKIWLTKVQIYCRRVEG